MNLIAASMKSTASCLQFLKQEVKAARQVFSFISSLPSLLSSLRRQTDEHRQFYSLSQAIVSPSSLESNSSRMYSRSALSGPFSFLGESVSVLFMLYIENEYKALNSEQLWWIQFQWSFGTFLEDLRVDLQLILILSQSKVLYNYIRQFIIQTMKSLLLSILIILASSQIIPNCHIQNNLNSTCVTCTIGYKNTNGTCGTCDNGYTRQNGSCVLVVAASSTANNSSQSNKNTVPPIVASTLPGFVVIQNPCAAINANLVCTSCIPGYSLVNGSCIQGQTSTSTINTSTSITPSPTANQSSTTNTTTSSNSITPGAIANISQNTAAATPIADNSALSSIMQSNSQGNISNTVAISSVQTNLDPSCGAFDPQTLQCTKCADSYHQNPLSSTVSCIINDPLCKTYTATYSCDSCYRGYTLLNGNCVILISSQVTDPYCKNFTSGTCSECYGGYYLSSQTNKCEVANSQCKTIDNGNKCLSCYGGYLLINGSCVKTQSTINSQTNTINFFQNTNWGIFYPFIIPISVSSSLGYQDTNCKNFTNGVCVECSHRTYLKNGVCTIVDPNCDAFNNSTGQCTTCYKGYTVSNGTCAVENNVVSKCPFRSVNINSVCVKVNDLCKSWSEVTALCTLCYLGYTLQNGICITQ